MLINADFAACSYDIRKIVGSSKLPLRRRIVMPVQSLYSSSHSLIYVALFSSEFLNEDLTFLPSLVALSNEHVKDRTNLVYPASP